MNNNSPKGLGSGSLPILFKMYPKDDFTMWLKGNENHAAKRILIQIVIHLAGSRCGSCLGRALIILIILSCQQCLYFVHSEHLSGAPDNP